MTKFSEIEDDIDDALMILEKYKKGFFLDLMLENNNQSVDTFDFLSFIRPGSSYGKKWYESGAEGPKGTARRGVLEPIPEASSSVGGKLKKPRKKMQEEMKDKSKTVKIEKSKTSSKCLLWFDRAKRILSDVEE
eukprot:CAMPEP_0205814382 /NCGR_PEP_ID=MMETSP0205-20121125/19489_1 /ASSEMBLY_ACC=CAM_ASM_000278 /TAXON_ID=36767 /ORGANISM="Euplotes focardii, Strain TN1" /LENGTH=133 /DNA_ID=CAMNT_0053098311 /DNA_START=614 /DNA_END=1012 /DNA_ORIENTATION=+